MRKLMFALLACSSSAQSYDFSGMQDFGGMLLNTGELPLYGLSHYRDSDTNYIALERKVGMRGVDPEWRVVDVLKVPQPKNNLLLYLGACSWNGEIDHRVIAVAAFDEKREMNEDVRAAWAANLVSEEIEPIGTTDVACYNEGWGL